MKKETAQRTGMVTIIVAVLGTVNVWLANRNDNNAKERVDKLKKEQWQQRRAEDSLFKAEERIFRDSVLKQLSYHLKYDGH